MEYIETELGQIPLIGLGTFSIPKQVLAIMIPEALKMGYELFDTAYKYKNETDVGFALRNVGYHRDKYLLETKICSEQLRGNLRYLRLNGMSVHKAYKLACKALNVSFMDVLMFHSAFVGYEKHFQKLQNLKHDKKVKFIGVCNISKHQLIDLKEKVGVFPDIVQCEIHPYYANKELILFCKNNGILVEARSPFAHGDAMEDWFKEDVLLTLAVKYKKSIPQIILRWVVQQNIIALPRTSKLEHLRENINVFDFALLEEEMRAIDGLNKNLSFGVISYRMK